MEKEQLQKTANLIIELAAAMDMSPIDLCITLMDDFESRSDFNAVQTFVEDNS